MLTAHKIIYLKPCLSYVLLLFYKIVIDDSLFGINFRLELILTIFKCIELT